MQLCKQREQKLLSIQQELRSCNDPLRIRTLHHKEIRAKRRYDKAKIQYRAELTAKKIATTFEALPTDQSVLSVKTVSCNCWSENGKCKGCKCAQRKEKCGVGCGCYRKGMICCRMPKVLKAHLKAKNAMARVVEEGDEEEEDALEIELVSSSSSSSSGSEEEVINDCDECGKDFVVFDGESEVHGCESCGRRRACSKCRHSVWKKVSDEYECPECTASQTVESQPASAVPRGVITNRSINRAYEAGQPTNEAIRDAYPEAMRRAFPDGDVPPRKAENKRLLLQMMQKMRLDEEADELREQLSKIEQKRLSLEGSSSSSAVSSAMNPVDDEAKRRRIQEEIDELAGMGVLPPSEEKKGEQNVDDTVSNSSKKKKKDKAPNIILED